MSAARPLLLALCLLAPAAAPEAGERFDRRLEDMLRRAEEGEAPTPEDQRAALRALRDWDLSERRAVEPGDRRIRELLKALAGGATPDPALARFAHSVRQEYLTDRGRAARADAGFGSDSGAAASRLREGEFASPEINSADYWLLLVACLAVFAGGVAVSALAGRRRRPDGRSYYT